MKPKKLTQKQQNFYNYLESYIEKYGYSPTILEIKESLNYKSLHSVIQYLEALEKHGLVSRKPNQSRGIFLTEKDFENAPTTVVPVLSSFVKEAREEVVAFKAVGNSMVDAGIESGDYVLAEITDNVGSGDLVVANIGDMAVVKRIEFTPNATVLKPESKNGKYSPIIMKAGSRIFGKVLDIIRMSAKNNEITYVPLEN